LDTSEKNDKQVHILMFILNQLNEKCMQLEGCYMISYHKSTITDLLLLFHSCFIMPITSHILAIDIK